MDTMYKLIKDIEDIRTQIGCMIDVLNHLNYKLENLTNDIRKEFD